MGPGDWETGANVGLDALAKVGGRLPLSDTVWVRAHACASTDEGSCVRKLATAAFCRGWLGFDDETIDANAALAKAGGASVAERSVNLEWVARAAIRVGRAEGKPEFWRAGADGQVVDTEAAERDKLTSGESKAVVNAIRIVRTEEASGCIKLSELSDTQQHKIWRKPIDHQRRVDRHGCGGGDARPVNCLACL